MNGVTSAGEHLEIERALAVLRQRWWVIALMTLLVGAASYVLSSREQDQYTAQASVLFQDPALSQEASGLQDDEISTASNDPTIMATNIQLLSSQAGVAKATAGAVRHGMTAGRVSGSISVSQKGQTNVAEVAATTPSPTLSAAVANAYVRSFIASQTAQQKVFLHKAVLLVQRQIGSLSALQLAGETGQSLIDREESLQILGTLQDGGAQLVTAAKRPLAPSSPKVLRNTALGVLMGLLLGLTLAFLLDRLDRRIKTVEELEATYQVPLLASVPDSKAYAGIRTDDRHGDREVFRLLRAYLRYFNVDRELRCLLVASAAPGDGKSTIARNLALAAEETGTRTLLIDLDMRHPTPAGEYGVKPGPGLSELLIGRITAERAVKSITLGSSDEGSSALDVLLAGHQPPNPAELIESHAMAHVLSWAAENYEFVVIDTPPLGVVSDAMPLLRRVDGVVLVCQLGKGTRDQAAFLRDRFAGMKAPLLGVIVNRIKAKGAAGYGYGYGYGGYGGDPGVNGRTGRSEESMLDEALLDGERNGAMERSPRFIRRR